MDNIKDDSYYIDKIISDINFVFNTINGISLTDFQANEVLVRAICFTFAQISESSSKLSLQFKNLHNMIPWKQINGLRNMVVHDYGHVKLEIIYDTIINDLPSLLEQLTKLN